MRHFILTGLIITCLNVGAALTTPVRTDVWDVDEQPNANGPVMNAVDWLWDQMLDRLTVPLGPADQNIWPSGPGGTGGW